MSLAPLILVVGPSGAGKDSLMDGARRRLGGGFHFARRVVTRPALAGAEDHDSVSAEHFDRIAAAGGFVLSWHAHGLAYGIPASIEDIRREGTAVVVNVSRSVVDEARRRLAPVGVVVVTASPDVLAARLAGRGRESAEDIRQRLDRAAAMPEGDDVRVVVNDGTLEEGVESFVAALRFAMSGIVLAVAASARHEFSKQLDDAVRLIAGIGVEGDTHAGTTVQHRSRVARDPTQPNFRQVHLIHGELFDELRDAGFAVGPGDLGENVTTQGLDLLALPTGTRLHLGRSAIVEITGLRNPCAQLDAFLPGLTAAVLGRDADGNLIRKAGIMGIVLTGGEIRPGNLIRVELPPQPHRPLRPV